MNPLLGRWISADPLAVHAPGEADLNVYAYVSGLILKGVDPLGLEEVVEGEEFVDTTHDDGSRTIEFTDDVVTVNQSVAPIESTPQNALIITPHKPEATEWVSTPLTDARDQIGKVIDESDNNLEKGVGLMLYGFMWGASLYEAPFRAPQTAVDAGQAIGYGNALRSSNTEYANLEATIAYLQAVQGLSQAGADMMGAGAALRAPLGYATGTAIRTPWGPAYQEINAGAWGARQQVADSLVWRGGTMGQSSAAEAQFWSLEHPMTPGFPQRMGIPQKNWEARDFVESANVRGPFITRVAPPAGGNPGGGIEVVVPQGGVEMRGFSVVEF